MAGEPGASAATPAAARGPDGGRFDFDDGGTYCGGWEDGKAHGHGVCTGPKGQGAYSGSWHYGFEVSGVYTWPSGSSFEGQWQNGKRHGLGVETRGRWLYRGEWTQGFKGRYGVRQSATSSAKYEGTWANGLQDGYGSESYADGGTYQGQWLRGMRHGYGVRASAPFGLASHYRAGGRAGPQRTGSTGSLRAETGTPDPTERRDRRVDDSRGGFVLKARSDEPPPRRNSLVEKTKKGLFSGIKIRKQRSTGDLEKRPASGSIRSGASSASWVSTESSQSALTNASVHTDSNASFVVEDEHLDASVTETYTGEWKNDKRTGFGVSERSDGLRYEGEWFANRKYGYGVTTFRDGTREEGKYKNNVLITSQKRRQMFLMRSAKFRERVDAAVHAAQRASKIALQKADIAISRSATARGKAEQADTAADQSKEDCDLAQITAKQFAPDFKQPGLDRIRLREKYRQPVDDALSGKSILHEAQTNVDQNATETASSNLNHSITHIPQAANVRMLPARRLSAAYPKTVQPAESQYVAQSSNNNQIVNDFIPMQNSLPEATPMQQNNYQQRAPNQNQFQHRGSIQQQTPFSYANSNSTQPLTSNDSSYRQRSDYSQNYNQSPQSPVPNQVAQETYRQSTHYQETDNYGQAPPESMYTNRIDQNRIPMLHNNVAPASTNETSHMYNATGPQYNAPGPQNNSAGHQYNASVPQYNAAGHQYNSSGSQEYGPGPRRNSRQPGERPPMTKEPSIDHYDHYKRPPSRDSSVDRYARATGRMSIGGSRQPSVDKTGAVEMPATAPERSARGSSQMRAPSPATSALPANGNVMSGRGSGTATPVYAVRTQADMLSMQNNQPFEEVLLRKRNLGQDIIPSINQPKRTESLYTGSKIAPPMGGGGGGARGGGGGGGGGGGVKKMAAAPQPLQRKKSLPDVQGAPVVSASMSREEVSALGSARREEVRRQIEETERMRANPLLYLISPQVKDWFSRQQLVLLVLFINISLAIMFFKLLT